MFKANSRTAMTLIVLRTAVASPLIVSSAS
jgi:hypothetical protein